MVVFWQYVPYNEGESSFTASHELHGTYTSNQVLPENPETTTSTTSEENVEDLLSQSLFSTASDESADLLSQSLFSQSDCEVGPTGDKEYNDEDVSQLDLFSGYNTPAAHIKGGVESTLTFKCMGATKTSNHQNALEAAEVRLAMGYNVPVKLEKEPDNPRDKNAVAFKCCIDEQWRRIGYVAAECAEEVNTALTLNKITEVKFAWVRYILHWPRCGPGTYAGINITKQGTWSDTARRAESTI